MKKHFFLSCILACLTATGSCQAAGETSLFGTIREPKLVVNNRILAKANGKAISVVDIMKKMDMMFYKQFPQYTSSVQARFQFYQINWKLVLNEMIDRELILADAEESKLVVSAGDVRQEMESLFGPNIITNLDKIGLTFNEASKMVLDDITMRRMIYFRVQSKAVTKITPQLIRSYYDDVAKDNIRDNEWVFNVVTIRHRDSSNAAETANLVHRLLAEDKIPLADLNTKLEETAPTTAQNVSVTVSEEFHTNEKELSEPFRKILVTLNANSYSEPIAQKSRANNSTVTRIFYLKQMTPGGVIPYNEMADNIRARLLDDEINKESDAYLTRLRKQFHVQEIVLEGTDTFQPFELIE